MLSQSGITAVLITTASVLLPQQLGPTSRVVRTTAAARITCSCLRKLRCSGFVYPKLDLPWFSLAL